MDKSRPKYLKWLAYIVPVAIFIIISVIYFAPQYQGKAIAAVDQVHYRAAVAENARYYEETGEDPQWNGTMFGGMPSYLLDFRIPGRLVRGVSVLPSKTMGEPAALIFTAMLCFWLMLILWGVNPWVGLISALAYGFSTYTILIIGAGHISKVWAMAYAPLLIGGVAYCYRGGNLWFGAATAALGAGLTIAGNHPQITYYFLLVIAALAINELVRAVREKKLPRFLKVSGVLVAAAIFAVGANWGNLYYTMHHSSDTIRGGSELVSDAPATNGVDIEYATGWSYGRAESFNMFIPNLYGGSSHSGFTRDGEVAQTLKGYGISREAAESFPGYWGEQPFTAGPTYIGAVVIFLAILGLFLLEGRKKWWILAISIFALFLAWGKNMMWFTELMFKILPDYSKFRSVTTALVIVQWTMPLLAAFIVSQLWKAKVSKKRMIYGLKWAGGITGGVALFFALFGGMIFSFISSADYGDMYMLASRQLGFSEGMAARFADDLTAAMADDRAGLLRADAWRSLLFVALGAGTIYLFLSEKIKRGAMVAILAGLVAIDLVAVDTRYLSWDDFEPRRRMEIQPTEADKAIMADTEPGFRVANFTVGDPFSDASTSYYHRSVGGYHAAKLQRYQDLIDRHLRRQNEQVYNMLNTKYYIVPDDRGYPEPALNEDTNGAAWFVDTVLIVHSPDEEIEALNTIDTRREAVVDASKFGELNVGMQRSYDSTAYITLTEYRPNHMTYEYSSRDEQTAVFSEIYYDKGWNAYVDGEPAEYFRADYVLRAMHLPAGEHKVEFIFRAPNFKGVSAVTLICSLVILLSFAGAAAWMIVRKVKAKDEQAG